MKYKFIMIWEIIKWDIPRFLKNLWLFRKEMWEHSDWDYAYSLKLLRRSLIEIQKRMKDGGEIPQSLDKKLYYMSRAIYLLDHIIEQDYLDLAELRLDMKLITTKYVFVPTDETKSSYHLTFPDETPDIKDHNRKIWNESYKIEKEMWDELFDILKGKDFKADFNLNPSLYQNKSYEEFIDGKGLNHW